MPKTLLLTPDFPPRRGGVARYLEAVAMAIKEDVRVVAAPEPDAGRFDAQAPFPIERAPLLYPLFWPRWLKTVRIMVERAPSYRRLIVSHVVPFGTAALLAGLKTKIPYVVIAHGMDVALASRNPWKKFLAGLVFRNAELVIANSRALKDEIRGRFGASCVAFVHTALTLKGAVKEWDTAPIAHPGVRLLTVSRLVARKGHLRVLEALHRLRERGELPADLSYTVVGDGPMSEAIERRAVDLGVDDIVHFHHGVTDERLPELYRSHDVFVMPTAAKGADREGFGIVYLEAGAYGLPCVATMQPGVDEAVLDGTTGVLVPDGDIEALARAIRRLALDADVRKTLGEAGRRRAQEEFSRARQAEKLRHLL